MRSSVRYLNRLHGVTSAVGCERSILPAMYQPVLFVNSLKTLKFGIILLIGLVFCTPSFSADVSRDIREGRQDESVDFSGYFELGTHLTVGRMPVVGVQNSQFSITLGGHLRIKRFFLDFLSESYHRGQFGYNLYSGPTWSFDLLATGSPDGIDTSLSNELDGLRDRSGAVEGGLRVTGYTGPLIVQFEALRDISGQHDGSIITGTLARQYLWQNWNFHWLLGARYQSADTTTFLFGVDETEASQRFPEYEAGAGVGYVTEFGATYPLNEYLVFRGTARYWSLPDSIANSPFIEGHEYSSVSGSLAFIY